MSERSSALDSTSGVVRMWVRIPSWPVAVLVSLSKTLNHNCFVLRMGRKAVCPMCCVMHLKRTQDTYRKREGGLPQCFWNGSKTAPKLFAPRNRFSLDRWRIINALYYYLLLKNPCNQVGTENPIRMLAWV